MYHMLTLLPLAILALLQPVRGVVDAWHLDYIYDLVNEELDPIVTPNAQGTHMHKVFGGNAFGASYNFDTYSGAACSTCRIQADKSNYWVPQLYWYNPALSKPFTPIPAHFRFYYQLARNSPAQYVAPFPPGLRMLVGNPNLKTTPINVDYGCLVAANDVFGGTCNGFNCDRDCPYGLKIQLYFPNCWDGVNLYKTDGSHMSYPTGTELRTGNCPWSHPIRIPTIQLETIWWTSQYMPGVATAGNLVWANGDTTGFGAHADFVNGWDLDLLAKALVAPGCVDINTEIPMEQCSVLAPYFDDTAAKACKPALGTLVEPGGNTDLVAAAKLPGCNPVWTNGTKPTCSPAVAGLNVAPFQGTDGPLVAAAADRRDFVWPTTNGWHDIDCFVAETPFDASNKYDFESPNLTVESCQAACLASGYPFAAMMEKFTTWKCQCGKAIVPTASIAPLMCNSTCPGNSAETCGGQFYEKVTYNVGGANTTAGEWYAGCLQDSSNGLATRPTYTFTSSSMTTEVCNQACVNRNATWALTRKGTTCMCGTDNSLYDGGYVPDSYCTMKCTGNSSEICGDTSRSSVWNITNSGLSVVKGNHPAGWQGCYANPSSGLALSNNSWTSTTLTATNCLDGCMSLGYNYSAVTNGNTCMCGNNFNGGQQLPATQCAKACTGGNNQTCGGVSSVELFVTSASTLDIAEIQANHSTGWVGCYTNSGTNVPFSNSYSYTSTSMTVETCQYGCAQLGYPYAGLSLGKQCNCGTTAPKSSVVPYYRCTTVCVGNTTETCGAGGYSDIYQSINSTTTIPKGAVAGYKGCFQDNGLKGLSSYSWKSTVLTLEKCVSGCKELGYSLGSAAQGNLCYCGNQWSGGIQLPDSSCTIACGGNSSEICGANSIQSLYDTSAFADPVKPTGWQGCYSDSSGSRELSAYSYSQTTMTINVCRAACQLKSYTFAGLEGGNTCYCDNAVGSNARVPAMMCATNCAGNSTQLCGGTGYIDVYNATGATPKSNGLAGYVGCFNDYTKLTGYSFTSDMMSSEMCEQICIQRGATYCGLRAGNTCMCGTVLPSSLTPTSSCSVACVGAANETCGNQDVASVYDLSQTEISTGAIDTTSNSTGYVGCFLSATSYPLNVSLYTSNSAMTIEACASSCGQFNYKYSGVYYGTTCKCGNTLDATSLSYRVLPTNCNTRCSGNGNEFCGSGNKMSVFELSKLGVAAASTSIEGYKGCYTVGTFFSAANYTFNDASVTATLCRRICHTKGMAYAAVTNARNCACNNSPTFGTALPLNQCTMTCTGNSSEICGSNAYASVYDTTGPGAYPPTTGYAKGYVGCFVSDANSLTSYTYTSAGMTVELCGSMCEGKGYTTFGVRTTTCYCGNTYPNVQIRDASCSSKCPGNTAEYCGSSGQVSVFSSTNVKYVAPSSSSASSSKVANATSSASSVSHVANATTSTSHVSVTSVSTSKVANATSSSTSHAVSVTSVSSSKVANATSSSTSHAASVTSVSSSKVASSTSVSKTASVTSTSALKSASATSVSASKSTSASVTVIGTPSTSKIASSTSKPASSSSSSHAASSSSSSSHAASVTSTSSSHAASVTSTSKAASVTSVSKSSAAASSSTSKASSSASKASSVASSVKPSSSSVSKTSTVASVTSVKASSTSKPASSTTTSKTAAPTSSLGSVGLADPSVPLGCYIGGKAGAFSSATMTCSSLTPAMCRMWCNVNGYAYAGAKGGNFCGCSSSLSGLTAGSSSDCSTPCLGDSVTTDVCGGDTYYSAYNATLSGIVKRDLTLDLSQITVLQMEDEAPVVKQEEGTKKWTGHTRRHYRNRRHE